MEGRPTPAGMPRREHSSQSLWRAELEYYSEDGLLTTDGSQYGKGATEMGCYTMVKHFVLNEQETNRNSNGILTWANEQAIREIYLLPFASSTGRRQQGIMSSFNRIGTTWTGGSHALCQQGYEMNGALTDGDFRFQCQYLYVAGYDGSSGRRFELVPGRLPSASGDKLTPTQASVIRTAAKNILYVIANSTP